MSAVPSPTPTPPGDLVGRRVDRYDILHRIASGGMGAVYIARARGVGGFERLVAIKVLHPHLAYEEEFVAMFLDEARLAARIRHPNVVSTLDVIESSHGYLLVMDYVEGDHLGSMRQRAARRGELIDIPIILRIVLDSLAGLAAAHDLVDRRGEPLNLVHRDISPANILVGVDGVARLTDFGVAKAESRLSSTREGQFKGKLAYAAPEQASQAMAEQRSDLFSMGVVLWEGLTGKRLFHAETNAAILRRVLDEPIPLPSSVRPELAPADPILARVLAREIGERFADAREMADAIEAVAPVLGGIASVKEVGEVVRRLAETKLERENAAVRAAVVKLASTPPPAMVTPTPRRSDPEAETVAESVVDTASRMTRRRRRSLAIGVALAVLAAAVVAAVLIFGGGPEPEPGETAGAPVGEPEQETGTGAETGETTTAGGTGETAAGTGETAAGTGETAVGTGETGTGETATEVGESGTGETAAGAGSGEEGTDQSGTLAADEAAQTADEGEPEGRHRGRTGRGRDRRGDRGTSGNRTSMQRTGDHEDILDNPYE